MFHYNRILHPSDYSELERQRSSLRQFKAAMNSGMVPFREDHEHREWEYSMILRQLEELKIPYDAKILDTGSGGSYIVPYLIWAGYENVTCSDSFGYGDPTNWVYQQSIWLQKPIPILRLAVEDMSSQPDESWDVSMCISTIEHIAADQFANGLKELFRVTKKGGYVFITSDFFRDMESADQSPFRNIQHTIFTPYNVFDLLNLAEIAFDYVGMTDEDFDINPFEYRGDFVNNYSFCNFCLRKQ